MTEDKKELDKDEQIKNLKAMVIYLAGVYQTNFNKFASSANYSIDVKKELSPEAFDQLYKVFMNFNTVQGSQMRDLVEELASLKIPMASINTEEFRSLFDYDRKEVRSKLYQEKYSDEAKAKKIEDNKKLWEKTIKE